MPSALPIVGSVVGGLMSKSGGGGQTASKEPWSEVVPWLKDNIASGQKLQQHYQQNPFNAIQQEGLQGMLDTNRLGLSMFPQLMGFANSMANQNYQRSGQRGLAYAPQGGQGGAQPTRPQVQMPTSMPQSTPVNWSAMNPFSALNNPQTAAEQKPAGPSAEDIEAQRLRDLLESLRGAGA